MKLPKKSTMGEGAFITIHLTADPVKEILSMCQACKNNDIMKKPPMWHMCCLCGIWDASCLMRKQFFCTCKNKGADQLWSNPTADKHFCFHYIDSCSTISQLATSWGWSACFVSDLVSYPEDMSFCYMTYICLGKTQVNLAFHPFWSAFAVRIESRVFRCHVTTHQNLWMDCGCQVYPQSELGVNAILSGLSWTMWLISKRSDTICHLKSCSIQVPLFLIQKEIIKFKSWNAKEKLSQDIPSWP